MESTWGEGRSKGDELRNSPISLSGFPGPILYFEGKREREKKRYQSTAPPSTVLPWCCGAPVQGCKHSKLCAPRGYLSSGPFSIFLFLSRRVKVFSTLYLLFSRMFFFSLSQESELTASPFFLQEQPANPC